MLLSGISAFPVPTSEVILPLINALLEATNFCTTTRCAVKQDHCRGDEFAMQKVVFLQNRHSRKRKSSAADVIKEIYMFKVANLLITVAVKQFSHRRLWKVFQIAKKKGNVKMHDVGIILLLTKWDYTEGNITI